MKWKSLFILFIFSSLLLSVSANSLSPDAKEIRMYANDEPFEDSDNSGKGSRSLPMELPFSAYLNEDASIDLDFYRAIGEVEIVVFRDGEMVYSATENVTSFVLKTVVLPDGLSGQCLLEIKGGNGAYAYGWFSLE